MSIPLDRLYQYIENIAEKIHQDCVLIYRFYPHGSKKLEDLSTLITVPSDDWGIKLSLYCNDQEPLNYDFYQNNYINETDFFKILENHSLAEKNNLKKFRNILA